MSLLNGMDEMFENKTAEEIAARDYMFIDELSTEAMESIDCLVDGPREDYPEIYDDDDFEEAIEAAALTGNSFLNSLNLSQDDPIENARKMHGSLGPKSSAANFPTNFHDDFRNTNDPYDAYPGSVGPDTSVADHAQNFHDEYEDDNDPLQPIPGSVGPESSTAKDPATEGTMVLGFLMNEDVDDFDTYIAQEGLRSWSRNRKIKKRELDEQLIGIDSLDSAKINQYCNDGMWNKAEQTVNSAIKAVEERKKSFTYGDPDSKKKAAAADRLMKTYSGLLVHLSMGKGTADLMKQGYDQKTAQKASRSKAKELKASLKKAQKLDSSTEAAIDLAIKYSIAAEQFEDAGSVGQKDSAANFSGNFADGSDDPSATYGANVPGASSAASFDGNQGGGFRDYTDPIIADTRTPGQDDSTARDPATESYDDILADLSALETELGIG